MAFGRGSLPKYGSILSDQQQIDQLGCTSVYAIAMMWPACILVNLDSWKKGFRRGFLFSHFKYKTKVFRVLYHVLYIYHHAW